VDRRTRALSARWLPLTLYAAGERLFFFAKSKQRKKEKSALPARWLTLTLYTAGAKLSTGICTFVPVSSKLSTTYLAFGARWRYAAGAFEVRYFSTSSEIF
jgi:hypothetical protein